MCAVLLLFLVLGFACFLAVRRLATSPEHKAADIPGPESVRIWWLYIGPTKPNWLAICALRTHTV
jgi:hypothetical protein